MSHLRVCTSRRRGFSFLETQVAMVLFMMTLSGVVPLVVIQTRQLSRVESRFEPATTHYLIQPAGRWAKKLGAPVALSDNPPEASSVPPGQWLNRIKIIFTGNDPSGTQNLDNFPVLVSLTASVVDFDKIKAGGADIRFVDADNTTPLQYQIESWDDVAQTATIWVNVPRIDHGSTTDKIYLYYNNSVATDASSTATWNSDYRGVWHLNEGTGATIIDATSNTNDGTPMTFKPVTTTGKVGAALAFNAADDWFEIPAHPSLDLSSWAYWTISAWIKPSNFASDDWPVIYSYGFHDASLGLNKIMTGTDGQLEHWRNDSTYMGNTGALTTLNQWNYVVVVRDPTTTRFYLNGVEAGSKASVAITNANQKSYIGGVTGFDNADYLGLIDEVRVSGGNSASAANSQQWIAAQYKSMNGTFNTFSTGLIFLHELNAPPGEDFVEVRAHVNYP